MTCAAPCVNCKIWIYWAGVNIKFTILQLVVIFRTWVYIQNLEYDNLSYCNFLIRCGMLVKCILLLAVLLKVPINSIVTRKTLRQGTILLIFEWMCIAYTQRCIFCSNFVEITVWNCRYDDSGELKIKLGIEWFPYPGLIASICPTSICLSVWRSGFWGFWGFFWFFFTFYTFSLDPLNMAQSISIFMG